MFPICKQVLSIVFFFVFLLNSLCIWARDTPETTRVIQAVKTDKSIKVDGVLDEEVWATAQPATDFKTFSPTVGEAPSQKTEIRVLYSNQSLYIGAMMYDVSPDSVMQELGERDQWFGTNSDVLGMYLDTYDDDQNGFAFFVTAAGVQADVRYSSNGTDSNWDAVWHSKAKVTDEGWVVEMEIPYGAIRFPEQEIQDWGIGFMRRIRRIREQSTWHGYDPAETGFIQQLGTLKDLKNIEPPLRLSITPYASAYVDVFRDKANPDNNSSKRIIRGGMDVKYGINESFTLDMTLIPDFGQVQSDDEILNLSAFEVRYNERRPFFTESVELFNKVGLFYSRRIGGSPINFYSVSDELEEGEEIVENPSDVQMFNGTKLSGRTPNNLAVGVLNAVTGNTFATVKNAEGEEREILTNPLTNYNITVFDQAFKNASYLSFINTNVWRKGSFRDANVTGTAFRWGNKKQTYALEGSAALSQIFEEEEDGATLGHKHNVEFGKTSGNLTWNLGHRVIDAKYDQRDFGFLRNNNEMENWASLNYNIYKPFYKFNGLYSGLYVSHSTRYKPFDFQSLFVNAWGNVTFAKSFTTVNIFAGTNPVEGNDFWEPRVDGRFFKTSRTWNGGFWISTDYRKTFAIDMSSNAFLAPLYGAKSFNFRVAPRVRVNDRLSFQLASSYNYSPVNVGFVTTANDDSEVYFGARKRPTVTNQLSGKYSFSSVMGLNLRVRHYWSKVIYDKFYLLKDDGYLTPSSLEGEYNNSFNAWTVDFVYSWVFSPGSQLSVVWKNQIFQSDYDGTTHYETIEADNYFNNFSKTLSSPGLNSLSLRLLYYLDYQMVKRKR